MMMNSVDTFFNNTTTQFYLLLTGTSSLLSGMLMFLEWLHFTIYGLSIIERLAAFGKAFLPSFLILKKENSTSKQKKLADAKPIRNSMALFRGAELYRYQLETNRTLLTDYDFDLSTSYHLSIFTHDIARFDDDPADVLMISAWKEKDRYERISIAHRALVMNPNCVAALILLAEEEAQSLLEVEDLLKQALKSAEANHKESSILCHGDPVYKPVHERNANVCAYCRFRQAICSRRLGKVKEAIKLYRDLLKDSRALFLVNIYENLTECLLESQSYCELNTFLSKHEETLLHKSTSLSYTVALLKAKALGEKLCIDPRRGPTPPELAVYDAIHRAVELNPHVPRYLLELKPLIPPPEHVVKRGDSEAIGYAFHHLSHWKRIDGSLSLLASSWEATFQRIPFPLERGNHFPPYPSNTDIVDRELLPPHHEIAVFPQRDTPFFMVFTGVLCFSFMSLTVVAYHFPQAMTQYAKTVTTIFLTLLQKLLPEGILGLH